MTDIDSAAITDRAAAVTIEMQAVISLTMSELTPRQRADVQFLAHQTYLQGRIDAMVDSKEGQQQCTSPSETPQPSAA